MEQNSSRFFSSSVLVLEFDLSPAKPKGMPSEDSFPNNTVLHVFIPENSKDAQISLTYGKDAEQREDKSYGGTVIHRSDDMVSIVCKFGNADKVENYVIYPNKGTGFLITYSSYLGSDYLKQISVANPEIAYGTMSAFRLFKLEK
ncbi:MAG: hypothetical protein SGI71_07060 [Verrucomicrobiota bacterium]|nr:hypothetical protein [Verrucomicrobiota bacterium]